MCNYVEGALDSTEGATKGCKWTMVCLRWRAAGGAGFQAGHRCDYPASAWALLDFFETAVEMKGRRPRLEKETHFRRAAQAGAPLGLADCPVAARGKYLWSVVQGRQRRDGDCVGSARLHDEGRQPTTLEGNMGNVLVGGIYVVQAKRDDQIEYWAAATIKEKAVAAVEKELGPGWTVTLTDRRLTGQRLSKLRMRPNSVQKL